MHPWPAGVWIGHLALVRTGKKTERRHVDIFAPSESRGRLHIAQPSSHERGPFVPVEFASIE
jgi:hypothetical protein